MALLKYFATFVLNAFLSTSIIRGYPSGAPGDFGCSRIPFHGVSKTPGDNGFGIRVEGDPTYYILGETYTISLSAPPNTNPYKGFILIAHKENDEQLSAGTITLIDTEASQFTSQCSHSVTHRSNVDKRSISFHWTAPFLTDEYHGCVYFKATVVQQKIIWFKDEGKLTKVLCKWPDSDSKVDRPTLPPTKECCSCGSGKYQLVFTSSWSSQTHPKDYPTNSAHFSSLIGATHDSNYSIWNFGDFATDGVKEVAEWGATIRLEKEMGTQGDNIRTVIKTGSIWSASDGKTSAIFSTDSRHHLLSVLSMLAPSPDWNVGVNNFELCTDNCDWIENQEIDMMLWDAGTDSGITFKSSNYKTEPQERIYQITSSNPDNPRSPFFNRDGSKIPPLARLTIKRLRTNGEQCVINETTSMNPNDKLQVNCIISEWGPWSECTRTCKKGKMIRHRTILQEAINGGKKCPKKKIQKQSCNADIPCPVDCKVGKWSVWSRCHCLTMSKTRNRIVTREPEYGGKECPSLRMEKDCKPCEPNIFNKS